MNTAQFYIPVTTEWGVALPFLVPSLPSCFSPSQITSLLLSTAVNQLSSFLFGILSHFLSPAFWVSFKSFCPPGQKQRGSCHWPFSLNMKRLLCLQRHYYSATTIDVTDTTTPWTWALFIVSVEPSLTGWETDERMVGRPGQHADLKVIQRLFGRLAS